MSYIINNSRGNIVAVVAPGTVNTTATPIALVGQGVTDYGTAENQNYVWILENFCNTTAPNAPLLGQLWYNNSTDTLTVYNTANAWVALASQDYVQAQKISPQFTGTPTAPTAANTTANTQIATTQFVGTAIINSAAAVANVYAPLLSPAFVGTPTAPTAAASDSSTQLATTAFVQAQKLSPQFTGTPTAPTATASDSSTQLATTAFVQAQKLSPQFTGTPTAPTAAAGDSSTQLATTAFVQAQKISPQFTGTPTAPTVPSTDSSTQLATTAFVQAQKLSPQFTGTPTAPTPSIVTNDATLATTAYVLAVINPIAGYLGTMSLQSSNSVAITGGTISGISPLSVSSGGTGANNATDARVNLGIPPFPLSVANGGTGSNNASSARDQLGLGSMAIQNANVVNITGGSISGITALPIASGGTGADTITGARNNLGLASGATTVVGTMATQNANAVTITGGTIINITDLAVTDGGTGASNAADARTNLGLGSISTQNANAVSITGGSMANVTVTGGSVSNVTLTASSPIFTGVPTAPTAANTTANTQIATTAFVQNVTNLATGALGTMSSQNANAVTITGGFISNATVSVPSPIFTGVPTAPTAANTTANTQIATTAFVMNNINTLGTMSTQNANAVAITGGTIVGVPGLIPVGGIIIWSGSVAAIPSGWALCNGVNGTPDLRGVFVLGAGSTYAVGNTGGSTDAVIVNHSHVAGSIVNDPGHSHEFQRRSAIDFGEFRNDPMAFSTLETATTTTNVTGITVNTVINDTGVSGVNANMPPYYALCYIMRLV